MLISVYVVLGQAAATTTAAADDDNDANNGVSVTKHSIRSERTGIIFFWNEKAKNGAKPLVHHHYQGIVIGGDIVIGSFLLTVWL